MIVPSKNFEVAPLTALAVVAIAVNPTPAAVHQPQVNQYSAPAPAVVATSVPVHTPQSEAPMSTSVPAYPGQEESKPAAPASAGISSYLPKHVPTPTRAQMAMAASALGAISSASVVAGKAARTQGAGEAGNALSGFGDMSAFAARATSGINSAGINANTAAKATATAAKLLELSGLSSLW